MIPRSQLPVHSPLPLRALFAGLTGAIGTRAHAAVTERVRSHFNAVDVLLTSSGTSALALAIGASARPSGVVALPAFACYDLATAADSADAKVVLYDVDPATLAPAPASLARALAYQPDALVLVHLYGMPVDVRSIIRDAAQPQLVFIEDAAQAFGGNFAGSPLGTLSPVSVLSFGRGKGVTAGAGGALLANDGAGAEILRRARMTLGPGTAGWSELVRSAAQWLLARPEWYEIPVRLPFLRLGETVYHLPQPARQLSNASAQMLPAVWLPSVQATELRRTNARRLHEAAAGNPRWQTITTAIQADPSYLRLPLVSRAPLIDIDVHARRLGVSRGYPLPLFRLDRFRERCQNRDDDFPGASLLADNLITVPTHGLLSENDLVLLERWLRDES